RYEGSRCQEQEEIGYHLLLPSGGVCGACRRSITDVSSLRFGFQGDRPNRGQGTRLIGHAPYRGGGRGQGGLAPCAARQAAGTVTGTLFTHVLIAVELTAEALQDVHHQ